MADMRASSSLAVRHLAQVFTNILATDRTMTFEQFESKAIEVGHVVIAKAMAAALEQHDQDLCADLPDGQRVHDVRRRTLVTEVGDVSFRYHRVRNRADGRTAIPLADALKLPWNRQISPGALSFLAEVASEVSYQKAAELLARKGGSQVSAMTVMRALDRTEKKTAPEDVAGELPRKHSESTAAPAQRTGIRTVRRRRSDARKPPRSVPKPGEPQLNWLSQMWQPIRNSMAFVALETFFPAVKQTYQERTASNHVKGETMGSYEREQQMIAAGTAERGYTARKYFEELDAELTEETSSLSHRPDYTKTLFAPEHDDIYREFCAYVDLPKPRFFDAIEDPIRVEGYSAADVYFAMKSKNPRIVEIDGAAVYNMLVKLRTQPEISKKVLDFIPTCYQGGCGTGDAAYERGYYDNK